MVKANEKSFRMLLVGATHEESQLIINILATAQLKASFSVAELEKTSLLKMPKDRDIIFYFQDDELFLDHIPVFTHQTIVITSCYDKEITTLLFKKGASHVLYRPLERVDILTATRNVLQHSQKYWKANLKEDAILAFLTYLIKENITELQPVLSPLKQEGYFYPAIGDFSEHLENIDDYLEALAKQGFFSKRIQNRFRLCPHCNAYQINYREVCPACSSIDIVQGQMIHHFHCGHIDSFESYLKDTDLICPKCEQTLRHIGLDYEKPSDYFKCSDCQAIVPEPMVEPECIHCGQTCKTTETIEKNIYTYALTDLAQEVVKTGKITGNDLASILYDSHTSLHNKQYFKIELKREFTRFQRHKTRFTLVMARIENMETLQENNPDRIIWYVNTLFKALTKELRELDTTCAWDTNTLGILLPETNQDGGIAVAKKMNNNIMSLEYLFEIAKPEISFSVIQGGASHASPEQLISESLQELMDD